MLLISALAVASSLSARDFGARGDGQHDDAIYTAFASENPGHVAAVAIRRLSPAEAVLAGGRTAVNDHSAAEVPWVTASDGAGLLDRLQDAGVSPA